MRAPSSKQSKDHSCEATTYNSQHDNTRMRATWKLVSIWRGEGRQQTNRERERRHRCGSGGEMNDENEKEVDRWRNSQSNTTSDTKLTHACKNIFLRIIAQLLLTYM